MPKIIGGTLADHRALTRTKLFDALGELLAERPFDTITMSQIAARAGIGRTAVYNHFEDKEVLLLAYMREATQEFAHDLRSTLEAQTDPLERLRLYLRSHLEMTNRYHLASKVHLRDQVSHHTSGHLHDHANIINRILESILIDTMRAKQIPLQNPHLLVPLIHSCLAGQHLPDTEQERKSHIATVETFILRAVGAAPTKIAPITRPQSRTAATEERPSAVMRCPVAH